MVTNEYGGEYEKMKIGLSQYRKIDCDSYIFPSNIYEIEGIKRYSDLEAIQKFAINKLKLFKNEQIDIYLNTKLSTELLCVIQAAVKLGISVTIYHRDRVSGKYYPQELRWRPVKIEEEEKEKRWTLCRRRHIISEKNCIYEEVPEKRLFDFIWMDQRAKEMLSPYKGWKIEVYATGLSALMISVLNIAYELNISVNFLHYDEDEEEYFLQNMDEDIKF